MIPINRSIDIDHDDFPGRLCMGVPKRGRRSPIDQRALDLLRKSLDEGMKFFNTQTFSEDINLMMLHDDPEFKALLKRL